MVNTMADYDLKVQKLLEECKISPKLLNYIENFKYPYVNDVQTFYEQLLKIGQGTFGEVFKARCKRTGRLVALKKILMENEKEGFPITALREIKMLKLLRHSNITELIEVCTCKLRNARERFLFYLVFTFCEHDLAGLLYHKRIKFSLVEMKTMAKHILEGLNKIHKSNILHRDMKSANVLITSDGVLKLADFGLARLMIKQPDHCYTNRVVTLWYRPPELLLGSKHYGPSIDIWGAGCIIAELWTRAPILQGNTEQQQLDHISKLCGSINPDNWPGCEKLPLYFNLKDWLKQNYIRRIHEQMRPYLQQNDEALNLMDKMLTLSPERRPNAESALDHNFFWQAPLAADNIKELVEKLKGTNLFEYTSGCGAHANRRQQRPIAPAAPGHNSGISGTVNAQHALQQQQIRKPVVPRQQQQQQTTSRHQQQPQPQSQQSLQQLQQKQQQQQMSAGARPSCGPLVSQQQQVRQPMPSLLSNRNNATAMDAIRSESRKRPSSAVSGDGQDDGNGPPPTTLRRPMPLAQAAASVGRPPTALSSSSSWHQQQQQQQHHHQQQQHQSMQLQHQQQQPYRQPHFQQQHPMQHQQQQQPYRQPRFPPQHQQQHGQPQQQHPMQQQHQQLQQQQRQPRFQQHGQPQQQQHGGNVARNFGTNSNFYNNNR